MGVTTEVTIAFPRMDTTMYLRRTIEAVLIIANGCQAHEVATSIQNNPHRHHRLATECHQASGMTTRPGMWVKTRKTKDQRRIRRMAINPCNHRLEIRAHPEHQEGVVDSALLSKPKQHLRLLPSLFPILLKGCSLVNLHLGPPNRPEAGFQPGHLHGSSLIRGLIEEIEIGIGTGVGTVREAEIAKGVVTGTEVVTGETSGRGVAASVNPGVAVIGKTVALRNVVTESEVTNGTSDQSDHGSVHQRQRISH